MLLLIVLLLIVLLFDADFVLTILKGFSAAVYAVDCGHATTDCARPCM